MNRGYTRAQYLALIDALRAAVPDISLSTDLIVGFPGETEEDFDATVDMVARVAYDNAFVFRYSARPGTPAAMMPDQVPATVKAERNARLLQVTTQAAQRRSLRRLGQTVEVLVDGMAKKNVGELSGRTRCNRVVNFDGQGGVAVGDLAWVRVTDVLPHSLRGVLAASPREAVCS
jgi:tRNA-2-methylthio-N6-dimethylallyladenosine synthase